jgi:hypothetical protein
VDGREHDGIVETEECIHVLEATTSRKKEKAEEDCKKIAGLGQKLQKTTTTKAVRAGSLRETSPRPTKGRWQSVTGRR